MPSRGVPGFPVAVFLTSWDIAAVFAPGRLIQASRLRQGPRHPWLKAALGTSPMAAVYQFEIGDGLVQRS